MQELATLYRAAQFVAHNAHNLVSGQTFFEDHEFLGSLYATYEGSYDMVVERLIGLGQKPDLNAILRDAVKEVASYLPSGAGGNAAYFRQILDLEKDICKAIASAVDGASDGTQNLLQGLADESEARQYKLQQRLK